VIANPRLPNRLPMPGAASFADYSLGWGGAASSA
jgi:hypothetical protein